MLRMKNILSGLVTLLLATISFQLDAQSSMFHGEMFIPDNSSISIFGKHSFHNGSGLYPGQLSTERENKKGYFNFGNGSSWVGASDMQFIDGYVKVYHNEAFIFPTGANSKFRPVAISGALKTSAAYYDNDPSFINESGTSKVEPLLSQISEGEYWDVDGDIRTQVTLTWDARSNIESLTESDLNRLTMVGWRGNQWELIPSSIDRFTLDVSTSKARMGSEVADFVSGSITTNENIRPSDYDFITLGALNPNTMARVQPQFDVYPNPISLTVSPTLNYQFSSDRGGIIRLYSPTNTLLMEKTVAGERGVISLDNPINKAGVYVIGIVDQDGGSKYQKLVVVEE